MTKKSILRGLAQIIIVTTIAICAWCLPPNCGVINECIIGVVGCVIVNIYGILIEKGKL